MKTTDKILAELESFLDMPTEEYPPMKAMEILREYLFKYHIPIKHMGKIKFDIDSSFFEDQEKAEKIIMDFALILLRIYNLVVTEYGPDAEYVFGDMLGGMGITCHKEE